MSQPELKDKVLEWLSGQGFPLEMKVARHFGASDFDVIQSDYYSDPKTGVSREIDVHAYKQNEIGKLFLRLSALVECKAGASKPWIVFTSDTIQLADRARVTQRSASALGHYWLRQVSLNDKLAQLSIFQIPSRPGYGVTSAFSDRVDVPYTALMAAAGAADAEREKIDHYESSSGFAVVQFPIVITEAPLFECFLAEDGGLELNEIDQSVIVWRNPVYRMPHCMVHLVQVSAMASFVDRIKNDFEVLLTTTKDETNAAFKAFRNATLAHRFGELSKVLVRKTFD
jgi:hypothetical protein